MAAPDCTHWFSHGCAIAGQLAGTDYCPTHDKACEHCLTKSNPGPRQPNGVTASLAIRWLKANQPEELVRRMSSLQPLLECAAGTRQKAAQPQQAKHLTLHCGVSPGDVATMTAAVYSLHHAYPHHYLTEVTGTAPEIWEHNPHVTRLTDEQRETALLIDMQYPSHHESNQRHVPFLAGYTEFLGAVLGRQIPLACRRPMLYLSDEERSWIPQVQDVHNPQVPYWVVNAGTKYDYTCKQWPLEYYQEVVDRTLGRIQWVQIGAEEHAHPRLRNVMDLVGRTDLRQLIRLVYHSQGGLGPVTLLQHLCAAWEKPYVCLLGGREPATWVSYPLQHTLHTIGQFSCCRTGACWKSRVIALGDGEKQDESLCEHPVPWARHPFPACMGAIRPSEVVAILERYAR